MKVLAILGLQVLLSVDPVDKSFVVFLKNRVYPSRKQRGLYELDIRDKLLELTLEN